MVVTRGWEVEEIRRCQSKGSKWQICRINKSRDLMYGMVTTVNMVLNAGNFLREHFMCFYHTHTHAMVSMWGNGYINLFDCTNYFTMYMYINHVVFLTYI